MPAARLNLLVTGATGFTGTALLPNLLDQHHVRCFARPASDRSLLSDPRIEWVYGDVFESASLERALDGIDALINLVSLGTDAAPSILKAVKAANIRRAIFLSTTAIYTHLNPTSKTIRLTAETAIQSSGLDYTILRPTMIYGGTRDRNMCRLIGYVQRWPILPIFGSGEHLQQPVYVDDVAAAIVACLSAPQTIGKAYNIPGAAPLTYNQVVDTVAAALNRRMIKVHVPLLPFANSLRIAERFSLRLPIKSEQLLRLNEDKAFTYAEAQAEFGYRPRNFGEGIGLEIGTSRLRNPFQT